MGPEFGLIHKVLPARQSSAEVMDDLVSRFWDEVVLTQTGRKLSPCEMLDAALAPLASRWKEK